MNFLITRPQTQTDALQKELQKRGHKVLLAPLLEIALEKPLLHLDGLQSIILTSQNAVKALVAHPHSEAILNLPLVVVGRGTAEEARKAGFRILVEGQAGGAQLAEDIKVFLDPKKGALLHASGDVLAFDLQKALGPIGFTVHRSIVYRSTTAKNLPENAAYAILNEKLDAVLLMSPRTSQVWTDLIQASGLTKKTQKVIHFCLSEAVAAPLQKLTNISIKVALKPSLEGLLALIDLFSPSLPK